MRSANYQTTASSDKSKEWNQLLAEPVFVASNEEKKISDKIALNKVASDPYDHQVFRSSLVVECFCGASFSLCISASTSALPSA